LTKLKKVKNSWFWVLFGLLMAHGLHGWKGFSRIWFASQKKDFFRFPLKIMNKKFPIYLSSIIYHLFSLINIKKAQKESART